MISVVFSQNKSICFQNKRTFFPMFFGRFQNQKTVQPPQRFLNKKNHRLAALGLPPHYEVSNGATAALREGSPADDVEGACEKSGFPAKKTVENQGTLVENQGKPMKIKGKLRKPKENPVKPRKTYGKTREIPVKPS